MSDTNFYPFDKQEDVLLDQSRIILVAAGKRSGKTEVGAVKCITWHEEKNNYINNSIDPFIGLIIAPTNDMLRRLSLKKFMSYSKPFIKAHNKQTNEILWHDDSIIYGLSADNPRRIEGIKANWCWLDEVFQMSEDMFLESRARTADTLGNIMLTGSLGVQLINPKKHWVYKYFKQNQMRGSSVYEWSTADNPHFPRQEIIDLKDTLDPVSFRSMFEINWNTIPKNAVYSDFDTDNIIENYVINPKYETYVSIDWGWRHPMACLFFQYDRVNNKVYLFDEIVDSGLTLENLYKKIMIKNYNIKDWCCDISGNQEREQTGLSNVRWFSDRGIFFKRRKSYINVGISKVRSYIKNSNGLKRFFVSKSCLRTIDNIMQYKYNDDDRDENPIKENDDPVDALRYFFVNFVDIPYISEDDFSQKVL